MGTFQQQRLRITKESPRIFQTDISKSSGYSDNSLGESESPQSQQTCNLWCCLRLGTYQCCANTMPGLQSTYTSTLLHHMQHSPEHSRRTNTLCSGQSVSKHRLESRGPRIA
eukprot:1670292-Amphidinium_carterae.1